jgi:hypothetical protein
MANYTKSTNFASKDSLLSGNPSKLVRGSEIDTEFTNIATAITTKADSTSPTLSNANLTGTPTAPTAATGTSTTQVATTAFVTTNFPAGDNSYSGTQSFLDNKFEVKDNSDDTKKLNLQLSGITTGTTRTLTVPDKDGTIAVTSEVATLNTTNNTITSGTYSVSGSSTISITATHAFTVGQEVFITFTNTSGSALTAGKFTITGITTTTAFTINYGSSVTSAGNATAERYGTIAVANAAEMTAGTSQVKAVTPKQFRDFSLVSGTSVATTSGSTVSVTSSVPAWAKKLTVIFNGVSCSGNDQLLVQLGTSGSVITSGYSSSSIQVGDTLTGIGTSSSAGFVVTVDNSGRSFTGIMTICLISGTTWVASHAGAVAGAERGISGGGVVTVGGTVAQVQLDWSGSGTFDAGSVNIMYE